ncbi:MAG: 23S rRNA (pseudouridine(1915)-N(3))-methyltransferase RlmH [Gemmatimonadales bacterium]|nr:MAG: 23S rRNA (pseudouridine(1915)-N(3))-methyltransferase RlmH [Gemmatimonadales bacterium]
MITVIVVGRTRPPLDEAVREYETRAARYWKLAIEEVDAGIGRGGRAAKEEVRAAEAERIRGRIPEGADLWLLTREGRSMSSPELARKLADRQLHGGRPLALCVGGAFGFSEKLREQAHRTISLSAMTLPHEMARLILAEQLYRAGTILRGEPYHKGGKG